MKKQDRFSIKSSEWITREKVDNPEVLEWFTENVGNVVNNELITYWKPFEYKEKYYFMTFEYHLYEIKKDFHDYYKNLTSVGPDWDKNTADLSNLKSDIKRIVR